MTQYALTAPADLRFGDVLRYSMGPDAVVVRVETLPEPYHGFTYAVLVTTDNGAHVTYATADTRFRVLS